MKISYLKEIKQFYLALLLIPILLYCSESFAVSPDPRFYGKGKPEGQSVESIAVPAMEESIAQSLVTAVSGEQKVVVILIEFRDVKHDVAHSKAYYENLIFSPTNPRSMYNYFKEVSYNRISISGNVLGWYTSSRTMAYYGKDGTKIDNANGLKYELAREAVKLADLSGFDFSKYDTNGDEIIDHLVIIHAGPGQESGGGIYGTDSIWSHHWAIQNPTEIVDGLYAYTYSMCAETSPMGTFAHEFGHDIGLPDLYDTDGSSGGIGEWGLMGSGSWCGDGDVPSHLCAWSKILLGWATPKVVSVGGNFTLNDVEMSNFNTIIKIPLSLVEYFLIENRYQTGFDMNLPGQGLLIWHIDDSVGSFEDNNVNDDENHKRVDLEEADGRYDLDLKHNYGDTSDPYYQGNVNSFTPLTNPDSGLYSGAKSEVSVANITVPAPAMTFTISVGNVPPVADPQSVTTNEDTPVVITLTGSDVNGDALTYIVVSNPSHGSLSGTAPKLTYTPVPDYYGKDSFTFKVNDKKADSPPAAVNITINSVNDPPVANPQSVTINEDTSVAITLTGSDADGDAFTYSIVTPPSHGSLIGTAPNLKYIPEPDYNGNDSFTFKANDKKADSLPAAVSIKINPVNDPPVANNQAVTTNEDTPIAIVLDGKDVDGDNITYTVVTPPLHGSLNGTAPNLTYTPDPDYSGNDSLKFKVNDQKLDSNIATVSITINPVDDAPVANDKSITINEDFTASITLAGSDADGDTLTYTVLTQPSHGQLSGTVPDLKYAPEPDYNGNDSFTFKVSDQKFDSNSATISITINPVNDAPVAYNQYIATMEDKSAGVTLAGVDVDGDPLTYTVVFAPSHGSLSGSPPNLAYSPEAKYRGTDNFSYRVNDQRVDSNTAVVYIYVFSSENLQLSIDLHQGWNLFSIPLQLLSNDLVTVLQTIEGKYQSVFAYDGEWKYYIHGAPPGANTLTTIDQGKGYWINMLEKATLLIIGKQVYNIIQLKAGWNLVGYNSSITKPVEQVLSSINGSYQSVFGYGSEWKYYIYGAPSGTNTLGAFDPGKGYWINATKACVWDVNQ